MATIKGNLDDPAEENWLYRPHFPEHWARTDLYSLAKWVNGLAFRNIEFQLTGMPVIKIAEIKNGITEQTKFTVQEFGESVHVSPGDMLFSWSGQPESSIDVSRWSGPEGWLNQHIFRITVDSKVDEDFFYYLLKYLNPNFVSIARNKQTTGLGHVTKKDLEQIEVALPALTEQQAIAHVLGTLDDKIELNRRMNRTLEEMARAIFQDWFVDFGPTKAKMEGLDHYLPPELWDKFPDGLVDSELGEIPEGWRVATLNLLGEVVTGKTPSTSRPEFYGVDVPFLKIPDMHGKMYVVETQTNLSLAGAHSQQAKTLPPESVSVSCIATPGLVVLNHRSIQTNQQINSIVPNNEQTGKYIYWVCRRLASEIMLAGSGGSVFHNMNKSTFSSLQILNPTKTLVNSFSEIVAPIHSLILSNEAESRNLSNQRDALLPELLSGQLQGHLQPPHDGKGSEHHHPTKAAKWKT